MLGPVASGPNAQMDRAASKSQSYLVWKNSPSRFLGHVIWTTSFSMSSAKPFSSGSAIIVSLFLRHTQVSLVTATTRDVRNWFFISVWFLYSHSAQNEFGSLQFERRSSVRSLYSAAICYVGNCWVVLTNSEHYSVTATLNKLCLPNSKSQSCIKTFFIAQIFVTFNLNCNCNSMITDSMFLHYIQHVPSSHTSMFLHYIQHVPSSHTACSFTTYSMFVSFTTYSMFLHHIQHVPSLHTACSFTTYQHH